MTPYYQSDNLTIYCADVLDALREIPSESVHCVITSPPYFALRTYLPAGHPDKDKEIGLESSPQAWVEKMVEVFGEVRRVMRKDGTCFVNVGDSYAGSGKGLYGDGESHGTDGAKQKTNAGSIGTSKATRTLPPKSLLMMPARLAIAMQEAGWVLRSDIIWAKPNPMPESVTDRPTKSHEHLFMFAKSSETTFWTHPIKCGVRTRPSPDYEWTHKQTGEVISHPPDSEELWTRRNLWEGHDYYWDGEAVREKASVGYSSSDFIPNSAKDRCGNGREAAVGASRNNRTDEFIGNRNLRDVWTIPTESFADAHFATYPRALVRPCVRAGSSEKGVCGKCGAPWVRVVETSQERRGSGTCGGRGRKCIGVDLSRDYCELAVKRLFAKAPLFAACGAEENGD